MSYFATAFEKELRKLIEDEIGRVADVLAAGAAIKDYAEYRHNVGRIAALRNVLAYCEDVSDKLNKSM